MVRPWLSWRSRARRQVVDHVVGPEVAVADPAGRAPGERGQLDVRGCGPWPAPSATTRSRGCSSRSAAGVPWLGSAPRGGVRVAADLHLEDLHRGAVARLEQVVEDLAALRFRVVDQQPGVAAAAADRADAVEGPAARGPVDGDCRRGGQDPSDKTQDCRNYCADQPPTRRHAGQVGWQVPVAQPARGTCCPPVIMGFCLHCVPSPFSRG